MTDATRVTFLGTADAFNGAGRAHSCYWVDDAIGAYTVDFGPTALMQLQRLGRTAAELDAVYITHLHGDHIGGLAVLFIDLRFRVQRVEPFIIAGPPGTHERVLALCRNAYPSLVDGDAFVGVPLEFVEWPVPGERVVLGRHVRAFVAQHDHTAVAASIRIDNGHTLLAFSGDTGWHPPLVEVSAGADLFICECSGVEQGFWGHLSVEEIVAHRRELTARRMVLTHLSPTSRVAATAVAAEIGVEVADDGLIIELARR